MSHDITRAAAAGLFSTITPLACQVISSHIFGNSRPFVADLILAIVLGLASCLITFFIPFLFRWRQALRGLYFVIYAEVKDPLCSVINIEYEKGDYLIDVYDFEYKEASNTWATVQSAPHGHSNIYSGRTLREFHIISSDESEKSCIFFKFYNKQRTAAIIRYGCSLPFSQRQTGKMFKLSNADLCAVFNSSFDNDQFCNKNVNTINACKGKNRSNCCQSERKILHWVRQENDNDYIKIPQYIYNIFARKFAPVEPVPSSRGSAVSHDSLVPFVPEQKNARNGGNTQKCTKNDGKTQN